MTVVTDPLEPLEPTPVEPGPVAEPRPSVPRRAWAAPLWAHLVALALVLLAAAAVVGTDASFSADEGAAISQAQSLADGNGWIVERPVPEVDPDGDLYPLELSAHGPRGEAPFAKHPLYALVLAGADKVGGTTAMVALSLLGTLLAAALAAALASRLGGPGLARPALWAVGLGSPLFFDGNLVIAHTLGAAAVAAAVLVALRALDQGRRATALALLVGPLLALAVLLRTEALLFGVAMAVAAGIVAVRQRPMRTTAGLIAVASVAGAGLATVVENWWGDTIVGGPLTTTPGGAGDTAGLVAGRIHAFTLTWLRPSYDGGTVDLALIVMAAANALAVYAARRHPDDAGPVRLLTTLAGAAAVLAVLVGAHSVIPGLLIACPVLLAGILCLRRTDLASTPMFVAGATVAGFALAVLATQYSTGGSGEWGGRYFAIGLPVALPVALVALRRTGRALTAPLARRAAGVIVVCSLALAVMAVGGLRDTHRFTGRLVAAIDRTAAAAPGSGADRPIILTTEPAIPRVAWSTFDRQRWLLTRSEDLSGVIGRLRAAGIDRVTFVSARASADLVTQLGPGVTVVDGDVWAESVGWRVLVLDIR